MADITTAEVKRLAKLARIQLSDLEIEDMTSKLADIFVMIDEINRHDITGVEPTSQVTGLTHVTRGDTERDYKVTTKDLLGGPAKVKDGFIEVPSVQ